MYWDIFCKVIDNYGDAGIGYRLSSALSSCFILQEKYHTKKIRLFCDNFFTLKKIIPENINKNIQLFAWDGKTFDFQISRNIDTIISILSCNPPASYIQSVPPTAIWINLEYLTAEIFINELHLLSSPQNNALRKYFYFPGFTTKTGGLIHDKKINKIKPSRFLRDVLKKFKKNSKKISIFQYKERDLSYWLFDLDKIAFNLNESIEIIFCAGLTCPISLQYINVHNIDIMNQEDYEWLLYYCDLNLVRGEDSFVRAQLSGKPFIWDIYPENNEHHIFKKMKFFDLFSQSCKTASFRKTLLDFYTYKKPSFWWKSLNEINSYSKCWKQYLINQTSLEERVLEFIENQGKHIENSTNITCR